MVSTPQKDGFILSSPTGFPLATMEISEVPGGKYRPYFGQPVATQDEWIKEHQDRKVPERSAEDVYWEYVEKVGEEVSMTLWSIMSTPVRLWRSCWSKLTPTTWTSTCTTTS